MIPLTPLTPREIQVLELLTTGLSNKGIADRLAISHQTVKLHLQNAVAKIGAENRVHAAVLFDRSRRSQ